MSNTKSKPTLWIFIIIAIIVAVFEATYLINVDTANSLIASIFSFTFDVLSGSGFFSLEQLFHIHTTLDAINLAQFLIGPFGLMTGCCIMYEVVISAEGESSIFLSNQSN